MTPPHVLLATDGSGPSVEVARLAHDLFNPAALSRITAQDAVRRTVAELNTPTPEERRHTTWGTHPR